MLKKTDVYNFINKVKNKALQSIKEKYAIELKIAIESSLNDPINVVLKDAIEQMEYHTELAVKAQGIIKKYHGTFQTYVYKKDIKNEAFGHIGWCFPDGFDNIRLVHAEREEAFRKTKEEYSKIMQLCRAKKTGEQGKTALIALGFDVTWLDNLSNLPVAINPATMDIDKNLIFPCGESGV